MYKVGGYWLCIKSYVEFEYQQKRWVVTEAIKPNL